MAYNFLDNTRSGFTHGTRVVVWEIDVRFKRFAMPM